MISNEGVLLAIETAAGPLSCAVFRAGELVRCRVHGAEQGRAEDLSPLVRKVLDESSVAPSEVAVIAVSNGPGSYTGIRVGLAFAKGMAAAVGAEVRVVSLSRALGAVQTEFPKDWISIVKTGSHQVDLRQGLAVESETISIGDSLNSRLGAEAAAGRKIIADARLQPLLELPGLRLTDQPFAVYVGRASLAADWAPVNEAEHLGSRY